MEKIICHAERDLASARNILNRFRNKFGMTVCKFGMTGRKFGTASKFLFLFLFSFLFFSCNFDTIANPEVDESAKSYFEYWSSTCQIAKIEFKSANVELGGVTNLSAKDEIEINVIAINPKEFKLLQKPEGQNFAFQNEAGDFTYSDYSETQVDSSLIKIKAKFSDDFEGQKITLSGCLWPENRTAFSEPDLQAQNPELFASTSFIQNTPPDEVSNLHVPKGLLNGRHYVSFELPDQTKNKNKDSTYEVSYYLREENGSLTYKGTKNLSANDTKNSSSSAFFYYFDEQESNLFYEYTVVVNGPRGLKSSLVSTAPGLGVHNLLEPDFEFSPTYNGKVNADGYSMIEVDGESDTVSYSIKSLESAAILTGSVDGSPFAGETSGTLSIGNHVLTAMVRQDGCRDVTVTKNVKVVQKLVEPSYTFDPDLNGEADTSGFEYIEVATADDSAACTITSVAGTTISGTYDDSEFTSETNTHPLAFGMGAHTISVTVHKEYWLDQTFTKKIKVVQCLAGARIDLGNNGSANGETARQNGEDYTVYEYTGDSLGVAVTNSEAGSTLSVEINGTKVNGTATNASTTLNDGFNKIVATVSKQNQIPVVVEQNVYVVKKLVAPTITFGQDSNGNTDNDGYTYYEVEKSTDKITYSVTDSNSGSTLTTKINASEKPNSGELGIETYEIVATVTKPYCKPISETKKIKVVQGLTKPKITYTNEASRDGNTIKFSYLKYENLLMDVTNTYEGATMKTTIDGGTPKTGDLTGQNLDVGTHTIKVTVEKENYNTVSVEENIKVEIKPVYVSFENNKFSFHGADEGNGNQFDLRGTLCGETGSTARQILKTWNSGRALKSAFDVTNVDKTFVLQSPTEKFYFYSDGYLYDLDGDTHQNIGKLERGNTRSTRTLKELKKNKTFTEVGDRTSGGYFNCTFTLVLSEVSNASFSFTPALNGLADSEGYECIEVENSTDTVSYTISCLESGVSLSGTVNGSPFSGTKTGTLDVGKPYTLVARCTATGSGTSTVTRKIKVVTPLKKPTLRIWNGISNVTADSAGAEDTAYSDYNCYNVNLTAGGTLGTVEYIFDAESGVTVDVSDNGTERNGTDTKLALGPHTLTVTCSKPGYTTREFEEKVYIQGILSAPSIAFYKEAAHTTELSMHSHPEASSYLLYDSYDVELDKDGNCALYYKATPANTGSTVTVKENNAELSGKLALGPHTITVTATRQYCASNSVEKKIYVQGILSEPEIQSTNGTFDSGAGDAKNAPQIWKFSYLTDDSLKCKIKVGNTGNTVVVYSTATGSRVSLSKPTEGFGLGYDTVIPLEIVQTREYCKSLTTTKYVQGKIKPITLTYNNKTGKGKLELKLSNFGNDPATMPLGANINIHAAGKEAMTAYNKKGDSVNQDTWLTLNDSLARSVEITLNNPSDEIIVYTDIWRTDKSNCTMREHESTRSLSQIKEGKGENENAGEWTFIVDMYEGYYSRKAQPRITFSVSD